MGFEGSELIRYFSERGICLHRSSLKEFVDKFLDEEGEIEIAKKFTITALEPEFQNFFETFIVGISKKKNNFNKLIKISIKDLGFSISMSPDCLQTVQNMYNGSIETISASNLDSDIHQVLVERMGWMNFEKEEIPSSDFVYNLKLENGTCFPANNIFCNF